MEVDHVPYIFGSFSRRRHSQELNKIKRKSFDANAQNNVPISPKKESEIVHRTRSLSKPFLDLFHHSKKDPEKISDDEFCRRKSAVRLALDDTSPIFGQLQTFPKSIRKNTNSLRSRSLFHTTFEENVQYFPQVKTEEKISDDSVDFLCTWCKKVYTEPRVLSCLHSFCTKCLFEIENEEYNNVFEDAIDHRSASVCSEIVRDSMKENRGPRRKRITCPSCEKVTILTIEGIYGLPHNYVLQHKLVLASLNQENAKLLCDICREENLATHRCADCLINFCPFCTESHSKNGSTSNHEILALKNKAITKIARQLMCTIHPEQELILFCATCNQVVCRECMRIIHPHHVSETPSKACHSRNVGLKDALERTRSYRDRAEYMTERLKNNQKIWVKQCDKVEEEIEKFIDDYKKSLDEHKDSLLQQVGQVKDEQLKVLVTHQRSLDKKISEAKTTIKFTDDILKDGSELEILTFVDTLLKKLQNISANEEELIVPKITESVQFLGNEIKENPTGNFQLYGVISTQKVSLDHCVITKDGGALESLRVHRKVEIILETRDTSENPLSHGGLSVSAELWYRDAGMSCRALSVNVYDKKDGSYMISFTPDTPGRLSLGVMIKGQHIKGSPFPLRVRGLRPHRGRYHCCSWCSGAGRCACGGGMPGGGGGCGHGHQGHPGTRHWSCCAGTLQNSECSRQGGGLTL